MSRGPALEACLEFERANPKANSADAIAIKLPPDVVVIVDARKRRIPGEDGRKERNESRSDVAARLIRAGAECVDAADTGDAAKK